MLSAIGQLQKDKRYELSSMDYLVKTRDSVTVVIGGRREGAMGNYCFKR